MPASSMKIIFLKMSVLFLAWLLLAVLLSGCAAAPGAAEENTMREKRILSTTESAQVIVRFKDEVEDPSRPDFLADLSRTVAARVDYVRPMSGGAHVLRVETAGGRGRIEDLLTKLSQRPDVVYVEQDAVMMHRQKNKEDPLR